MIHFIHNNYLGKKQPTISVVTIRCCPLPTAIRRFKNEVQSVVFLYPFFNISTLLHAHAFDLCSMNIGISLVIKQ